jgi:anti-anti-sigma factor
MQRAAPWLVWPIFDVRVDVCGTTRIVVAHGDIDVTAADAVGRAIDGAMRAAPETLVIDLSGTSFLDTTAVHLMVRAERHARARGVRLQIIPARAAVHRVFTLCGVEHGLPFASTIGAGRLS